MKQEYKLALKYTWLDFWYAGRDTLLLMAVAGLVLFCFFYPVIAFWFAGIVLTVGLVWCIIVTYKMNLKKSRKELGIEE